MNGMYLNKQFLAGCEILLQYSLGPIFIDGETLIFPTKVDSTSKEEHAWLIAHDFFEIPAKDNNKNELSGYKLWACRIHKMK